ncbi:TetR/AcrR family transcriptional regulator [Amycolatopsis regifaucium]|uniref:TetR family transcriptional regulator n=1 Tax=Amycolatopsis regifaucium TaxID=546365 RepID=A0A154MFG8_9PSEU|nr:TetR/AcrR family transcriptional regulator [Amycolatopsis regifaucium]KZB83241.1 TetR family transcriptional regulator [Amycolatopsis regifaucium]OKA09106.1 TetR family transcriptional regulator [Amycolatopsis regifaucium]SFI98842.1 DNA-binding transcriptional regulator, AcrR family [Amycolatopsis regifaucium]
MDSQPAKTPRGRQTREAIVDAAAELMYVHGVAGTSVDKVLAASGAGKSQMYHYFKNKDQLVEAVIKRYLEAILGNQPTIFELHEWADFEQWTQEILAIQSTPKGPIACPLGNLTGELGDDPKIAPLLDNAYREWESHLQRGLESLREKGKLAEDADPARLAQAAMTCVQGGLLMAHLRHDITPIADALKIALEHLKGHARP